MKRMVILAGIGAVMAAGLAGMAYAQANNASTPPNFGYEIKDGKRVPKADNKTVAADGTVREEFRSGKCVTIKETRPDGAVKKTQKCD
jgi:uncharacterized protein YdeI (BOF family)